MARNRVLAKSRELQNNVQTTTEQITVGIDLGDSYSYCCVLGSSGDVLAEGRIRTTIDGMAGHFMNLPPTRIAIEVGTHSRWVSQFLTEWGHEVIIANPRRLRLIATSIRKSDQVDAQVLARLARVDPKLLSPVVHRSQESYPAVTHLKARDLLVRSRTRLINAVRGILKSLGLRLPASGTTTFAAKAQPYIPDELKSSLMPLLEIISQLSVQIYAFDKQIEALARKQYPETNRLRQVIGVGPITALQFVLTIGDPTRFKHSRDVAAYLGLTPRRRQSGEMDPQLRISKAGNKQLRTLLVQCAQYLLGHFGPDSDLKRWGTHLFQRGGKNGKKRAIVAVARKLAVLLHRLWITGEPYRPLHNAVMTCAGS